VNDFLRQPADCVFHTRLSMLVEPYSTYLAQLGTVKSGNFVSGG
jgi:hypothetical protein